MRVRPVVSTAPIAITRIVEGLRLRLPDIQVVDGPPRPPEVAAPDILCIGFTGIEDEPVVENSREKPGIATAPDRESYHIVCLASSWQGLDTDMEEVRATAYGLVDEVADYLADDHTLGGAVSRTRILSEALAQVQTNMGAVATVRFLIQIDAFTRR